MRALRARRMDLASKAQILQVWALSQRSLRLFHRVYEVNTVFIIILRCYLPFSHPPQKCTVEFSRSDMMYIYMHPPHS